MATTTNYSWTTPDDTALVKDGAAAIRSLGTAIDSTVFTNAGNAIAKTIVDAKGDIIAATAADTVSRLAVGANDTVLTADSSTATGLKWGTISSGGMTLLSTTSLTGSSVTISSISQNYTNLLLILAEVALSAEGINLQLRMNGITASDYSGTTAATSGTSSPTLIISTQSTNLMTVAKLGTPTSGRSSLRGMYNIPLYTTSYKKFLHGSFFAHDGDGIPYGGYANFNQNLTAAVDSLTIFPASGTFTQGSAIIYGVK